MAGISDLPFRLIAREFGCPLAFTEMVNARALGLTNRKTLKLLESSPPTDRWESSFSPGNRDTSLKPSTSSTAILTIS